MSCDKVNLSLNPRGYNRLTKKNKIKWDECFIKTLKRSRAHTKNKTKKKNLLIMIKAQESHIKKLQKKWKSWSWSFFVFLVHA
jgi:hypothetical protein